MNGSALASTRPYTHSEYSKLTANRLVVARYEQKATESVCVVKERVVRNLDTQTFIFSWGRTSPAGESSAYAYKS